MCEEGNWSCGVWRLYSFFRRVSRERAYMFHQRSTVLKLYKSPRQQQYNKESLRKHKINLRRAAHCNVRFSSWPPPSDNDMYIHSFTLLLTFDTSCYQYPFIRLILKIPYILFQSYLHFSLLGRPSFSLNSILTKVDSAVKNCCQPSALGIFKQGI